jgi:hypothetical protein
MAKLNLGFVLLYTTNDDEKIELIFWNLCSIWLKILNDIACNLNLIQIQLFEFQHVTKLRQESLNFFYSYFLTCSQI